MGRPSASQTKANAAFAAPSPPSVCLPNAVQVWPSLPLPFRLDGGGVIRGDFQGCGAWRERIRPGHLGPYLTSL